MEFQFYLRFVYKITGLSPIQKTVISAAAVAAIFITSPAGAELNKYEAATRGEFGIGSAAQYGSADLR